MSQLLEAPRTRSPLPAWAMAPADDHATAQARADAARTAPFWPFSQLTPLQQRQRAAAEHALQAQARKQLSEALL